ncbi:MAG: serpin family protein [Candidatus Campbellbacteria bacterium]|nr:serpin family protein [Candidatus Campbellbacteria bacterium]
MNVKILVVILIVVAVAAGVFIVSQPSLKQTPQNPIVDISPTPEPTPTPTPTPTPDTTPEPTPDTNPDSPASPNDKSDESKTTTKDPKDGAKILIDNLVDANNQFALDIYSELIKQEKGNIFFSPYSIFVALAMVYEGTKGKTAEEIQKTFHFPKEDKTRRNSFATTHKRLNAKNAKYKLSIANALWVQKDYKLLKTYLDTVKKYYDGNATNLDFVGATEESRKTINSWVEKQTNDKIKNLFPEGSLDQLTRLVLTNAIYFKGSWDEQFDKSLTREEDFYVNADNVVQVKMMRKEEEELFKYTETDNAQIIELPYKGKDLSMLIFLPKEKDGITSLENSLSIQNINEWRKNLQTQEVYVYIPKFTFNARYSLNNTLSKLGMPTAFTPGAADLSGIDGSKNLYIGSVVHQAFVDVNEEGTEAAAATGVSVSLSGASPPPPIFRADHPFIFVIQENKEQNILFLGKVVNPAS